MNTPITKLTAAASGQTTDDAGAAAAAAAGDAGTGESMPAARRTRTRKPAQEGKSQDKSPADARESSRNSKTEIVLQKLRTAKGATLPMLMEATGWQAHSVRGFLSGTVRRKLGLTLVSEIGKDGTRHYRIPGRS